MLAQPLIGWAMGVGDGQAAGHLRIVATAPPSHRSTAEPVLRAASDPTRCLAYALVAVICRARKRGPCCTRLTLRDGNAVADGVLTATARPHLRDSPHAHRRPLTRTKGLDADERAEGPKRRRARLAQTPDDGWAPAAARKPGRCCGFRSMWTVVGALVIAGSVVGAVISREALVCGRRCGGRTP